MLFQGLDNVSSATLRPFNSDINTPRIDSYRFSMANLEGELSFFLNLIHGDRHATYRAISVSVTLRSSSRKEEKKEEEEKSQKFFLLILFTLVKVAAASISDSCPPYVGQFFQPSSPSSILCFVNKRTAWTKGAFHPREIVACFSSAKRGKRGCGSFRRSYPLSD